MSSEPTEAIKILIENGACVDSTNDEMQTPLFMSVQGNNPLAASTLLEHNANFRLRNSDGLTAFELVKDIDEWIKSDFFESNVKDVLKSYISNFNVRYL